MVKRQQAARRADAKIRRDYLERAFDAQIHRLKQKEFDLHAKVEAKEQGAEGRLAAVSDQITQTELRRDERFRSIDRLAVARGGDVRHLATVIVVPLDPGDAVHQLMRSDPEVERIAMEMAMSEEVRREWTPEDVSQEKDGRGYDILSIGPASGESGMQPVRRIEVKGRSSSSGDVVLTRNEWIKAERLKEDYWLYVVYDARPGATPRLVTIQDPARVLAEVRQELKVVKGYRLPGDAIARAAKGGA